MGIIFTFHSGCGTEGHYHSGRWQQNHIFMSKQDLFASQSSYTTIRAYAAVEILVVSPIHYFNI